jgi:hypothetical protein
MTDLIGKINPNLKIKWSLAKRPGSIKAFPL